MHSGHNFSFNLISLPLISFPIVHRSFHVLPILFISVYFSSSLLLCEFLCLYVLFLLLLFGRGRTWVSDKAFSINIINRFSQCIPTYPVSILHLLIDSLKFGDLLSFISPTLLILSFHFSRRHSTLYYWMSLLCFSTFGLLSNSCRYPHVVQRTALRCVVFTLTWCICASQHPTSSSENYYTHTIVWDNHRIKPPLTLSTLQI